MSVFLDKLFIDRISFRLERFDWIRSEVANFKCPICGDSESDSRKRRGYFFVDHKNGLDCYMFTCHNCSQNMKFRTFLKEFDAVTYKEYVVEDFKDKNTSIRHTSSKSAPEASEEDVSKTSGATIQKNSFLTPVDELDSMHPCKQYVENRQIPNKMFQKLFFTEYFREVAVEINPETGGNAPNDARLVIPFYNENGTVKCIQGRALNPNTKFRYVTIKVNEHVDKVYGLERLDKTRNILVVEGPIDSMFLPNCVATADANLLSYSDGTIFIPDNQYRNPQIYRGLKKIIKAGKKVVIFPATVKQKDINDIVVKGGYSHKDLLQLIAKNVYQGLDAELRFSTIPKPGKIWV